MLLVVPGPDPEPWPTLGEGICDLIEAAGIYGPGSLQGEPYQIDPEFRAFILRAYQIYPRGHPWEGRRRFKRVGLSVRKGLAKCLAPDTPVSMGDGSLRRAVDLQVGDEVLGYSGVVRPARVSAVDQQPPAPMVRLTTERGRVLEVTADHPVLTRGTLWRPGAPKRRRYASCDPYRDREQWVEAGELKLGDRVVIALGWTGNGGLNTEDAWLLGAFCGDGCGVGRFCSADQEIIDRIAQSYPVTKCAGNNGYDHYVRGSAPLLRGHGMYSTNSRTKRVPAAVMSAKPEAAAAFLAGYLDTDGWVSYQPKPNGKTRIEIAWGSVNRALLTDCQHVLAGLGFNGSLVRSIGTYNGQRHESWKLAVRDASQATLLAAALLPHMAHHRKRAKARQILSHAGRCGFGQRDTDKVTSVEWLPATMSVAVEVAEVHTHVTAGIITHNTEKQALLAFCELHREGPTRFDGWDAYGNPVGRPVRAPYIPMLAVSVEQVEELAYGALSYIITEGPDADLFDVSLERILRIDERGRADGKAVPLANSPGARDGARTTMNCFDEPHRLILPRQKKAHQTMDANLPKRPLDDPWSLYVGTAGEPGEGSVMEEIHGEALLIAEGKIERPDLFYLYRTDDGGHDLDDKDQRIKAVAEATGPVGEYGPGQFDEIASKWDRPGADRMFLERVWLNRWVKSGSQAFDMNKVRALTVDQSIPDGAFVAAGFDGARFRDATALVVTDIQTGWQQCLGVWERPETDDDWTVPEDEVSALVDEMFTRFEVWRMYCDPPHWTETVASWAAKYPDRVLEWHTVRKRPMADAARIYAEAIDSELLTYASNRWRDKLLEHMGHAGRRELTLTDEQGQPLWTLQKQDGRLENKFDAAMAAVLSWQACIDARREGAKPKPKTRMPRRIY